MEATLAAELKICGKCGQATAEQFIRAVGKKQLCVLCAQREKESDQAFRELVEDRKIHGGHKWLWKHIATVVAFLLGYLIFRSIVGNALRTVFGGN